MAVVDYIIVQVYRVRVLFIADEAPTRASYNKRFGRRTQKLRLDHYLYLYGLTQLPAPRCVHHESKLQNKSS